MDKKAGEPAHQTINRSFVEAISEPLDLDRARQDLRKILSRYPFTSQRRQLSLSHPSPDQQSIEDGNGTLYDFETGDWRAKESDFRHFNREFKDTYFREIYEKAQELTGGKIGRMRLMNLAPKSCYSIHVDPTVRYHLALETNSQAFLIFVHAGLFWIPDDGKLYRVDTTQRHSAMNGGTEERIHLVLSSCG